MAEYNVEREDEVTSGRYVVHLAEGVEAEMTYRKVNDTTISIDHTFVPREFRSAGIALKLVERGVADARAEGKKILPRCSYVAAQFLRHPEWEDLRGT
jgi:predicted GNAT family acetyltransferase